MCRLHPGFGPESALPGHCARSPHTTPKCPPGRTALQSPRGSQDVQEPRTELQTRRNGRRCRSPRGSRAATRVERRGQTVGPPIFQSEAWAIFTEQPRGEGAEQSEERHRPDRPSFILNTGWTGEQTTSSGTWAVVLQVFNHKKRPKDAHGDGSPTAHSRRQLPAPCSSPPRSLGNSATPRGNRGTGAFSAAGPLPDCCHSGLMRSSGRPRCWALCSGLGGGGRGSSCRPGTWGWGAPRADGHSPPGWPAPSWLWRTRGSWGCGGGCAPRAARRARCRTHRQKQRDRVSGGARGRSPPPSAPLVVRCAPQGRRGRVSRSAGLPGGGGAVSCCPARSKALHPSSRRDRRSRSAGREGRRGSAGSGAGSHGKAPPRGGRDRHRGREPPLPCPLHGGADRDSGHDGSGSPSRARARRPAAPRASISRSDAPEARPPPLRLVFEGGGEAGS